MATAGTLLDANSLDSVVTTACIVELIVDINLHTGHFVGKLGVSVVTELAITVALLAYRFRRFC